MQRAISEARSRSGEATTAVRCRVDVSRPGPRVKSISSAQLRMSASRYMVDCQRINTPGRCSPNEIIAELRTPRGTPSPPPFLAHRFSDSPPSGKGDRTPTDPCAPCRATRVCESSGRSTCERDRRCQPACASELVERPEWVSDRPAPLPEVPFGRSITNGSVARSRGKRECHRRRGDGLAAMHDVRAAQ